MTQETETLILKKLDKIESFIANINSEECFSDEACAILRIKNERHLKTLRALGHIKKFSKRAGSNKFSYNKAELFEVKEKLDNGDIIIVKTSR